MTSPLANASVGSSPRMRGSPEHGRLQSGHAGIIPAYAGLTHLQLVFCRCIWNHPRVCEAHESTSAGVTRSLGSSPRMRGSRSQTAAQRQRPGIIPAHAGLTASHSLSGLFLGDHPRACGAHPQPYRHGSAIPGSSPRMRGSRIVAPYFPHSEGIIPAHAGLTNLVGSTVSTSGDHPRACGAHSGVVRRSDSQKGSSPRMRGSPSSWRNISPSPGIIPAHAGLTSSGCTAYRASRDHPRACGAHDTDTITNRPLQGSSPRMRSSRRETELTKDHVGIIPAHAGLT